MEDMLIEVLKQSPVAAVLVFLVVKFLSYLRALQADQATRDDAREKSSQELHERNLTTITKVAESSAEVVKDNTKMLGEVESTLRSIMATEAAPPAKRSAR